MAYAFTTESHACYKVENGRISRIGESQIYDQNICRFVEVPIMDEPFTFVTPPTPGEHFAFTLKNEAHRMSGGPITTSRVVNVYPIVHLEMYDVVCTSPTLVAGV